MEQTFSQEEENIVGFIAWTQGTSINDITQDMKEALYPTISQLPENSKRMLTRIGGVIRQISEYPDLNDEFWNKTVEEQKDIKINSAKLSIKNLGLKDDLNSLYLDLVMLIVANLYEESEPQTLHEQIKKIMEKESAE